ncbi:hypothetical protein R6Q59_025021 [Mikania micrantha]
MIHAEIQSLLEYHGVPVYQSMSMLKSSNGLMNTLATNSASKYDFTVQKGQDVTIKAAPLIRCCYRRSFSRSCFARVAPAPGADAPAADSPKASKKTHKSPTAPASSESPADSPESVVADQEANGNKVEDLTILPLM